MILKSTMTIQLVGKLALATEFSAGIGLTTAVALAQEGEQLITAGRRAEPHPATRSLRKPDWLLHELLRLKAHMLSAGCRQLATTCMLLHSGCTVGKSFVAELIARHQWEIAQLRRQIRSAKAPAVRVNRTWAMDLSFFTDSQRHTHAFIGVAKQFEVCD